MHSPLQENPHRAGWSFAAVVRALAITRGDAMGAEAHLRAKGLLVEADCVQKAMVLANTSDDAFDNGMAQISYDLAAYLRPRTLMGRLPFLPAPFLTRTLMQAAPISAAWVAEQVPIPFRASAINSAGTLRHRKVASGFVFTAELARAAVKESQELFLLDCTAGIREKLDRSLVDPDFVAVPGLSPESLTSAAAGALRIPSSGTALANIDADLEAAVRGVIDAGLPLETARWVMHPRLATRLAAMRGSGGAPAFPLLRANGGLLFGVEVVTSTACVATGSPSEYFAALIECGEVLLADEGAAQISVSTSAAIELDDAPAGGEQQLLSLWQNDLAGMVLTRTANWQPRRPRVAAVVVGINL